MKQFSKILSFVLAAVMVMSIFAACGNEIEEPVNGTPATDATPAPTEPTVTDPVPPVTDPTQTEPTVTEPPATEPPVPETTPAPTVATDPTKKPDDGSFTVDDLSATMYVTDSVNVRSGPNADYKRIGSFKKNEQVTVTGRASTGWYRVDYKGEVGYVSNSYLTDKKPSAVVTTEDDTGDVHIDEDDNNNGGNGDSQGGVTNVTYGDWAKDNGWEYMLRHMTSDNYVNAINAIVAGMQQLETSIFIDASYIPKEEIPDFANLISPIIAVEYCYVKKVTGFGTGQYDQGIIRVDVEYYVDNKADADRMVKELRNKADSVIGKLKSSWSDYQKIQYLHDWLVLNVTPDEDSYEGRDDLWAPTAYGAIVDGRATCLGYAKGMFYLLTRAGFDTVFEVGKGHAAKHIWTKVRMDGKWYNIDPTWDDPVGQTAADPDLICYDYFMVSDNYMTMSHTSVYNMYFYSVPSASSDSKCWHKVNGYYISDSDDISKVLKQATKDAVNGGNKYEYVRLKFATVSLYEEFSDKYSKSYYNSSYLPDYSSKYTCVNKYLGTKSGHNTHSCTLTYRLSK